jgi:hypothetical protein
VILNKQVLVFAESKEVISDKLVYEERKELLLNKQELDFADRKKVILHEQYLDCAESKELTLSRRKLHSA